MNVLIFVISLCMLLSVMTYGKLNVYRNFIVTEKEFENYMEINERKTINDSAIKLYKETPLQTKKMTPQNKTLNASSLIPVHAFIFPKGDASSTAIQKELLKNLMVSIYGNHKKFREFSEKNPQIIEDMLNAIQRESIKRHQEKKTIKTVDALRNLDLENQDLNDLYYWMTKGIFIKKNTLSPTDNEEEDSKEHQSSNNLTSFLDFITVQPQYNKIRVYLASSVILSILFNDPYTVDDILKTRLDLYKQAKNGSDVKNLEEQFRQQFSTRANGSYLDFLDFTVTKSNPNS